MKIAPAETYDPAGLIAYVAERQGQATLRSVARRLGVDPALLCRPLSSRQADRYATALGAHPGEIWPSWWARS